MRAFGVARDINGDRPFMFARASSFYMGVFGARMRDRAHARGRGRRASSRAPAHARDARDGRHEVRATRAARAVTRARAMRANARANAREARERRARGDDR